MLDLARATDKEAANKIRECTIDLLGRSPLFGLTVLGTAIRVQEKVGIDTMCTDGRTIWYSPAWVHKKPRPSVMFDILHETLHCFGNHPARRGTRDFKTWGYAIDVRVAHDALKICRARGNWELDPDHIQALPWAEWMSAEEIYERLLKDPDRVPKDFKPDIVEPQETQEEADEFKRKLTQDVVQATYAEEQQNKEPLEKVYGKAIWDRLQELRRCDVPWDSLLRGRLCASLGQDLATWLPPNRRWFPEIALPSRRGSQENELLLGIDISGSITNDDLARFRACIMPAARRAKKTTVVTFDQEVRECVTTTRPELLLRNIKFRTGSHMRTDVRGVFAEVDKRRPTAVAIITDGHIELPETPYPATHWILTPRGVELKWGRHYRMHASW